MKKRPLISVTIYLPGEIREFMEGKDDVVKIEEIAGVSPTIRIFQGKSDITYCGFPYIYKEKTVDPITLSAELSPL